MPQISMFYGIVIYMYYNDHAPPHFHAIYGEYEALIQILPFEVLRGNLPKRAMLLVKEWVEQNVSNLMKNWRHIENAEPLEKIPPLE